MSGKKVKLIIVLGIIIACFTSFGCASTTVNLLKNKTVELEKISYRGVRILRVFVQEENGSTKISGIIKNTSSIPINFGHVDISIISPEGTILKEASTQYIPKTLKKRKRHSDGSRFYTNLQFVPPEGSKVRIAFHKTSIKRNRAFNCNENQATIEGKVL
jgi:hypothetical protein